MYFPAPVTKLKWGISKMLRLYITRRDNAKSSSDNF